MADFWPAPKPAITVTRAILLNGFPGKSVTSEQPTTRPSSYFVLGLLNTDFDTPAFTVPRVLVECWSETAALAEELAGQAIRVLANAKGLYAGATVNKGMRDIQGPSPLNDPDIQDRRRFQFHGELYLSTR